MKSHPAEKADVLQGTLILLVLRTLEALGPLHGYGIARRIEQISGDLLQLNQGTLYPALLRMEQEGWIDHRNGELPRRIVKRKILFHQCLWTTAACPGSQGLAAHGLDHRALSRPDP